ncbi:hypothetical protein B0H63DRAFT_267900 [Podospora didyma]|uniref:Uncharacterized protein n=1 Tax=Podospora didyma TaxID=330526 RepID=A0AAE0N9E6_9PEZI|nr:hypothetical protein B0H63DRAFT_267900 [Podospora didyma]
MPPTCVDVNIFVTVAYLSYPCAPWVAPSSRTDLQPCQVAEKNRHQPGRRDWGGLLKLQLAPLLPSFPLEEGAREVGKVASPRANNFVSKLFLSMKQKNRTRPWRQGDTSPVAPVLLPSRPGLEAVSWSLERDEHGPKHNNSSIEGFLTLRGRSRQGHTKATHTDKAGGENLSRDFLAFRAFLRHSATAASFINTGGSRDRLPPPLRTTLLHTPRYGF